MIHVPGGGLRLVVRRAHDGERLDRFLAAVTGVSRRRCRDLVASGEVRRNGRPCRVQSRPLETGDVIDVPRPASELGIEPPAVTRVGVLHADPALIVADKPAGMLTQPAEGTAPTELTLDEAVLVALAEDSGRRPFLRLVHRIDRLTSGAVLFARTQKALPALARAWRTGSVERRYIAIVEGVPDWSATRLDQSIARDTTHRWRFQVDPEGRACETGARVVARLDADLAVVECRLATGRTHQVRVHLAAVGHPVLGDRLYGSRRAAMVNRPLLHAASLALPHPDSGARLEVTSPLPEDLRGLWPGAGRGEAV